MTLCRLESDCSTNVTLSSKRNAFRPKFDCIVSIELGLKRNDFRLEFDRSASDKLRLKRITKDEIFRLEFNYSTRNAKDEKLRSKLNAFDRKILAKLEVILDAPRTSRKIL